MSNGCDRWTALHVSSGSTHDESRGTMRGRGDEALRHKTNEWCYFFVCDEELGCLNSRTAVPEGGHAHGARPSPHSQTAYNVFLLLSTCVE